MANLRSDSLCAQRLRGEIGNEPVGGRQGEQMGEEEEDGVEKQDHSEVNKREVGQQQDHHHVLQQIHRKKRRVGQEIALLDARSEHEHALHDHALHQRHPQNGDETPHGVGAGMDGGGAVGVGVELRASQQFVVGMDAFDDESDDGDLG